MFLKNRNGTPTRFSPESSMNPFCLPDVYPFCDGCTPDVHLRKLHFAKVLM